MTQVSTNQFLEGPNYPAFIAEDRAQELRRAALRIDREERVSDFGNYWLCTPLSQGTAGCQGTDPSGCCKLTGNLQLRADTVKDTDCTHFLQWALPRLGLRWAGFRRVRSQVCKRLGRRLADLGLKDLSAYRTLLEKHSEEWRRLDGLCRVSVSRFYRDQGVWNDLEGKLLPWLVAQVLARGESRLRIWSAGCASGEEPYTLALMFAFAKTSKRCEPAILATDADSHLLCRARCACYPPSSLRTLPESWRTAFEKSDDEFCLSPAYRMPVRFMAQDIRRDFPDGLFDLVLCRNLVFTYFQEPLQSAIAGRLAEVLVPGGLLLLGSHEFLPEAVPGLARERPWLHRREM